MYYNVNKYFEPSKADILMTEFTNTMYNALVDVVRDEIEALHKENKELKENIEKLKQCNLGIETTAAGLSKKEDTLEKEFYRKKLKEVLAPFIDNLEVYAPVFESLIQSKCEHCDEKRMLMYTAPGGNSLEKHCSCYYPILRYVPKLTAYQYIKLYKDPQKFTVVGSFESFGNSALHLSVEMHMILDRFTEETLKEIKDLRFDYSVVFTSKDECQKYCNYLNERGEGR